LSFWWRYTPHTTFDNRDGPSRIQAIEFAMNLWSPRGRFEWGAQWENILGDNGAGMLRWRIWTGHSCQDIGLQQTFHPDHWYYVELRGAIVAGLVRYIRLTSGTLSRPLNHRFAPTELKGNYIPQVAFQLDGNFKEQPYTVYFDRVSLRWYPSNPW
jgi:hypothetical protein